MVLPTHPAFLQIVELRNNINSMTLELGKVEKPFREIYFSVPVYSCSEAGFLRSVSFLYMLYYEAGRVNVEFLVEQLRGFQLDPEEMARRHVFLVHSLRTSLQHSLDLSENRNQDMLDQAKAWFRENCGSEMPSSIEDWDKCLSALLMQTVDCMNLLFSCVTTIKADAFCDSIISQWNSQCSHYHPPHEYDRVISIVAADIGMPYADPVKIRKRFYETWSKELENLTGNYNFEIEARKQVQAALLKNPVLPITTQEIMETLNQQPGPVVGEMLRKATEIYQQHPCTGPELLELLKAI
jgi:hypothetical protein